MADISWCISGLCSSELFWDNTSGFQKVLNVIVSAFNEETMSMASINQGGHLVTVFCMFGAVSGTNYDE